MTTAKMVISCLKLGVIVLLTQGFVIGWLVGNMLTKGIDWSTMFSIAGILVSVGVCAWSMIRLVEKHLW